MQPVAESQSIPASITELVGRWATMSEFASDIGLEYQAARKMRDRESISTIYWERVIAASKEKGIPGIDWEWLGRVHSRKSS